MIRIGGNELPGPRNQAGVLGNMCTERYCQPDMWQEDGSCVWSVSLSGQHVNRKQWAPPVRRHQASPGGITLLTCHWPRGQFIFRISNTIAIFVVHNTNNKFSTKVCSLVVEWRQCWLLLASQSRQTQDVSYSTITRQRIAWAGLSYICKLSSQEILRTTTYNRAPARKCHLLEKFPIMKSDFDTFDNQGEKNKGNVLWSI